MTGIGGLKARRAPIGGALAALLVLTPSIDATASPDGMPEIRTSPANAVPSCVTPARLMAFLKTRNPGLSSQYESLADWYRRHGETWGVRWDYAFFQMALETNFLTYRQGNGRWGDVNPNQFNFAGIGTTGGGVPGDGFRDVSSGVLAQIQHLVVYSGERVPDPVAPRTRLKQEHIIEASLKLKRPVRFSDLARRWAVDRRYGHSIEWVASKFRAAYCDGRTVVAETQGGRDTLPWATAGEALPAPAPVPPPKTAKAARAPQPKEAARKTRDVKRFAFAGEAPECVFQTAGGGGEKILLIRSGSRDAPRFTALSVLDGFEDSMLTGYLREHAPDGAAVGSFRTRDEALAKARELCKAA